MSKRSVLELLADMSAVVEGNPAKAIRMAADEIVRLREQVEKLTAERDEWKNDAINGGNAGYLREQLAALAEQNEKMRKVLLRLSCLGNGDQYGNSIGNCIAQEALSLPQSRNSDTEQDKGGSVSGSGALL